MDVFLEYLIKRKYSAKEYFKVVLFGILSLLLAVCLFIASMISYLFNPILQQILFILLIADVYFGYVIITRQNVEYEYALTNTYFDIDRIIAKRRREDVISIDLRDIEEMRRLDINHYKSCKSRFKEFSILGNVDQSAYYFIANSDGVTYKVVFNPPQKMVDEMKKFLKSKFID